MNKKKVRGFITELLKKGEVYAPVKKSGRILVEKIDKSEQINWSGKIPNNTFKSIVLPPKEELFSWKKGQKNINTIEPKQKKTFVLGINILDLQALALLEQVFEKDYYFQKRRQNIYYIGFTGGLVSDFRRYKVFHQKYEEDVLEHLIFDVFIEKQKNNNHLFFSGSEKGQRLLENNKIKDYENIEFAGLIPEEGADPRIEENKQAVLLNPNHPLWDELARICLGCGRCTLDCPTCFCFDQQDEKGGETIVKTRKWGSCLFPEFSKVAGGKKDLETIKKRLYFWYYHKFVRIADEYNYYGCVSCMRCFKTCPVAINIAKNLQKLKKAKKK